MTLRRIAIVVGLLALVVPAAARAQGLGDAAAHEKAKRQAAKKAGEAKVFTNEDLNEGRAGTPAGEAATPATPSSENPPPAADGRREEPARDPDDRPDEETERRTQEQMYVDALTGARSGVAQIEARIQELQAKLNPMSPTFVYGDFNGLGTDKVAAEADVKAELAQAEVDLNAARQTLADATRALQEFRLGRATAPPEPR